ncbi:MAG: Beta-lactamase class C-like and penicillin binding proteins (PBPs) superfamily [uncultured Thermomicrobiales bacterium]|uniref:Beta-lactamase class C-like and penicillin binding proteins (PBPs) superfamily n=1 Tax=uncultured Thermomicrobiales bacterium TaxID=1645740 RepID=A0A6J4VGS2_9BACT|nr:MAG: Beta-lactamase class C-like and penicillin binding proteins (PBPs) superfamily [uncultured Thermomicrobiales bacterium]
MVSTATEQPRSESEYQSLEELIEAEMARLHVPGVSVGLLHDGQESYAAFGVTNVDHPLPVDPDTLFQIGSTTKTVTATAAMRLVEAGKLDLDAPVRTYLPDLRLSDEGVAAGVTMRHLLQHTAGWSGDYFADPGSGDDALGRMVESMADLPQLTPLGEVWSYNNAAFYLAGRVIEVVAGQGYEAAAKELVLAPLGMDRSFFFPADLMTYRFAAGHIVREEVPTVARPWALPRVANPAGGITSSARDQLRYARFQMGDGTVPNPDGGEPTRLLGRASLELMQTPAVQVGGMGGATGLAWFIQEIGGVKTVRHGGGTNGQISEFMFAPERGFALTILTNADEGGQLNTIAVKWALQHYLGIADPEPEPLETSEEQLAEYAGRYTSLLFDVELTVRDGSLVLQSIPKKVLEDWDETPTPPPARLALLPEDGALALDPPYKGARGEFLRGLNGDIAWFRFGGRLLKREG